MELLPHAQPCPPDRGAVVGGGSAAGDRRSAPALHPADQLPREVAGVSLARAFRLVRDGRSLSAGDCAVCRVEPLAGTTGRQPMRLALQQAQAQLAGQGRRVGKGCSVVEHDWRLAGFPQQRRAGIATQRHSTPYSDRSVPWATRVSSRNWRQWSGECCGQTSPARRRIPRNKCCVPRTPAIADCNAAAWAGRRRSGRRTSSAGQLGNASTTLTRR